MERTCKGGQQTVDGQQAPDTGGTSKQQPKAKAKLRASSIQWQAADESHVQVSFTIENSGAGVGRPTCFIEVDARDLNDECFGECGAQEIFRSRKKISPGVSTQAIHTFPIQGGAAPNVYDVTVDC